MTVDIDHLARLVRLALTPEEKTVFSEQFPRILDYIDSLQSVELKNNLAVGPDSVLPTSLRADQIALDENIRSAVINAFPEKSGTALKVPGIFG
mgnify:CR=1 FL=1